MNYDSWPPVELFRFKRCRNLVGPFHFYTYRCSDPCLLLPLKFQPCFNSSAWVPASASVHLLPLLLLYHSVELKLKSN